MSAKSKKNRRNISPALASEVKTDTAKVVQNQPSSAKGQPAPVAVPTAASFKRDLGFIALTTAIIVILMIVAYYVVPR
jgi:hypothetical protein